MAEEDAHIGLGAQLLKGDGNSPENFLPIMGIKSISFSGFKRDAIDVSDLSTGNWKKMVGGMVDGGTVSFDGNFLPRSASQAGFLEEFDKSSCDSNSNWRINLPECEGESEGYFEFAGPATGGGFTIPMDAVMTMSGEITISGKPTLVILQSEGA